MPFEVRVPEVEELVDGEPADLARENATRKARAVAAGAPRQLVLGADTIVVLDGRAYGKPADEADAREMLQALRRRRHVVLGGICVTQDGRERCAVSSTFVQFREFDARLADWYLASGEWRERAGGYAIQGRGAALVAAIEGDYFNVVGLPVAALLELVPDLVG